MRSRTGLRSSDIPALRIQVLTRDRPVSHIVPDRDSRRWGQWQGGAKLHYAWVVAAVTFLTLLAAAGVRATPGVLIVPLETEFGWSRATISFAVGINIFLYGLIGPFAAAVMDRFGLRRTMLAALALIAAGVALTPLMTQPWQLMLLWGVVVGTGSGTTALVLGATVASRWFAVRRGLVMGVLTASTATGQLVFLPLLASIAVNHGWRMRVVGRRRRWRPR